MKTKLVLISTITIFSLTNCQEKIIDRPNNEKTTEKKMETSEIKNILIKQIETGSSAEYWGDDYGKEDLDALVSIEDTILKNNGYKTPEKDIFNQKIKTMFGRIIDNNSSNQYLKIDTYLYTKCDKELNFYPYTVDAQYLYVDKKNNFITFFYALPQILDYLKIYPDVLKYEEKPHTINTADGDVMILRWKDVRDLPKQRKFNQRLLISRNKYLFNDDQSQFAWLINNDKYFMRSLVTTFGYTEDKKLLKWVIENTELPLFYKYAKSEILDNLGRLLWTKDCNGNIRVHQNTLDILKELSPPENNLNIMYVAEYLTNSLEENQDLNDSQKAKIAAYLLYWGEQFKYDKRYDLNQMFMGHYYHYMDDGTYEKEFIKNNYYGLPKFKEWYEAAKKEKDCFNGGAHLEDDPQPLDYESRAKYIK
ncbi:hypothetical protein [Apibacter sp. HY039]|uniref:hypothetical protein n=1 Tax=Apibacter sp. HY039 TaxID=2501476 RepID=UPI000FEBEAA4|nr:hypothetical protein [Apibacter sp. HY039]